METINELKKTAISKMNNSEKIFFELWYFITQEYPGMKKMDNISEYIQEKYYSDKKIFSFLQGKLIKNKDYSGETINFFPIRKGTSYKKIILKLIEFNQ